MPERNGLHLQTLTACPRTYLHSMPSSLIELKYPLPGLDLNQAGESRAISPSTQQAMWPIVVFIALCHEDRLV